MSGGAQTRVTGTGPNEVVVAVTPPAREGAADLSEALLERAAALAGELGAELAALEWDPAAEADLAGRSAAVADRLREGGATVVLLADDDLGRQLAPLLALQLRTSAVVGCSDVVVRDGATRCVRPVQGGWLERETVFAPGYSQVATLRVDTVAPHTEAAVRIARWKVSSTPGPDGAEPRVRRVDLVPPDPRTVDLMHARRIVGVGAGGASEELLASVSELADLLEGSVGATRPVVDDGWLPKERLIGQTGKTVAPELYLALGVSGSPHHVAGVQGAGHIVAVNQDGHAPIVTLSDTSFVGRLEEVLPELVRQLRGIRDAGAAPEGDRSAEDQGG